MMFRHALLAIAFGLSVVNTLPARAATPSNDATQIELDRRATGVGENPTAATRERAPTGNPLWGIPLGTLSITRERPIFSPSRRPPAPAVVAMPHIAPVKPVVRPPEPEHPNLALIGTVIGDAESIGVFLDPATQRLVRLKTGEGHAGWILRSVRAREVTLAKGNQSEILSLPTMQPPAQPPETIQITR